MPDVTRSDSQRSDTSLRPRVSFNRDVHVKRIVPPDSAHAVGAQSGDGIGHLVATPVRKERLKKSKKELKEEAARVIHQADKIDCVIADRGVPPEKFYTLPRRKKPKLGYSGESLERRPKASQDATPPPPKKPPRSFVAQSRRKPSVFDLFRRGGDEPKKSSLRRSASDAASLKKERSNPDDSGRTSAKKPLTPIIEAAAATPPFDQYNNENNRNLDNCRERSVTEQLKQYIDEVDEAWHKETGVKVVDEKPPEVVIIDVDKAEKISSNKKKPSIIKAKFKSLTNRKAKANDGSKNKKAILESEIINDNLPETDTMIHSSQKPVDKLPLTRGRTVGTMVKLLNSDQSSPPPPPPSSKTNILIAPNVSIQHNNNQPFSYTRGLSPDKCASNENLAGRPPIIYAQVVCSNGAHKQTVHTEFNGKTKTQSDSDEGLGCEETTTTTAATAADCKKRFTRFGDTEEDPITPRFRTPAVSKTDFFDSTYRGRGDGMDAARRREDDLLRNDLSARRDLLESRINRRLTDKITSYSMKYIADKTTTQYNNSDSSSPHNRYKIDDHQTNQRNNSINSTCVLKEPDDIFDGYDNEPKSFDSQISDYRSSPENNKIETSHKYISKQTKRDKKIYKSTPEIYHQNYEDRMQYQDSYHDSLRKHEKRHVSTKYTSYMDQSERKDKFGDSGIENDFRRDSAENFKMAHHHHHLHHNQQQQQQLPKSPAYMNDSEDEGFASSLLIANERQYADGGNLAQRRDYHRHQEYVPRERSIDDGAYFDPRLDKDVRRTGTLTKLESKPPKPEKKSGLEKVKQLFTRDSKKKKGKHGMVREESLRARYREYKGSTEELDPKKRDADGENLNYTNRRRLSTPSSSPTREAHTKEKPSETHNWFKSLDRLSRKKTKKEDKDEICTSTEEEMGGRTLHAKNLRFFGDTDADSSDAGPRPPKAIKHRDRTKSQSTRELHNISEEMGSPAATLVRASHKSLTNIWGASKPPISPGHKPRDAPLARTAVAAAKKKDVVREESSTEGDSSQQSQRSVVYLHAATVGDIPGPAYLRNGKAAASREELNAAAAAARIQQQQPPQIKTLSRSFSMLAPWRPRHYNSEHRDIDYSQQARPPGKYEQRPTKGGTSSRKENTSTLKKKAQDTRRLHQSMSTLTRRSRSKENMSDLGPKSKDNEARASMTLYKKKERLPRENSRYYSRDDKKMMMSSKSQSVESLRNRKRADDKRDVSRSMSMPKNSEKTAGWFKKK